MNTLQRTLVLMKQVEADKVDAQLALKRQEFWQRMQALGRRRAELELQQQEVSLHPLVRRPKRLRIMSQTQNNVGSEHPDCFPIRSVHSLLYRTEIGQ